MKYFSILIFLIFTGIDCHADEEATLFGNAEEETVGFYGALTPRLSGIRGEPVFISGVRAGVIFNKSWAIGAGAYNLASRNIESGYTDPVVAEAPLLDMNYFGVEIEYIRNSNALLHYTVGALFGAGFVKYDLGSFEESLYDYYDPDFGNSWFFVFEPMANAELNVTKWMRIGAGAGYRLTVGALYHFKDEEIADETLSNFNFQIFIKFGVF
jgi:hypothetical protein